MENVFLSLILKEFLKMTVKILAQPQSKIVFLIHFQIQKKFMQILGGG